MICRQKNSFGTQIVNFCKKQELKFKPENLEDQKSKENFGGTKTESWYT